MPRYRKDDDLPPLKPGAKVVLRQVEAELRKGFTGTFVLECQDGGIRDVQQSNRWKPSDVRDRPA